MADHRSTTDSPPSPPLDRLTHLPDSLLLQIISQLPIQDAVRTSALSTKWKHLWKHADEVTVNHPIRRLSNSDDDFPLVPPYDEMVKDFVSVLNLTLPQYTRPNISRFTLLIDYVHDSANQVLDEWFQWIHFRNVKILFLKIPMSVYSAPNWFSHCSAMEKLDIEGPADVKLCEGDVNWSSLRSLSLSGVDISDEDFDKVMLGCPVLETLDLNQVSGMSMMNVVSPTVRAVRVVDRRSDNDRVFEVNAPWIQDLEISGSYRGGVVRLENVSSLGKARITFECVDHFHRQIDVDLFLSREVPILEALKNVEDLTFGSEFVQVLSLMKLVGRRCPSFKCKHLTLRSRAYKHELPGVVYLLQNSPALETLDLEVESPTNWEDNVANHLKGICGFDGATYLSMQNLDFPCLKSMKISRNFYLCSHRDAWRNVPQFDLAVMGHIARYARFLETIIITSPRKEEEGYNCSRNCSSQYFSLLSRQILQSFSNCRDLLEWKLSINDSSSAIVCTNSKFIS